MKKIVDMIQITEAIRKVRERGDRVTCRNVHGIVGGSMTTVHTLLDEALAAEREITKGPTELSESLTQAVLFEIRCHVQGATEGLEFRIAELTDREKEILSDLEGAEVRVDALETELAATQARIKEELQSAEKAAAVAVEQISGLKVQLEKLAAENDHLIRAGEAARTETAKAQLSIERADLAAQKAEAQIQKLDGQVLELMSAKTEAEKVAAVAECHAKDLSERIAELTAQVVTQAEALQKGAAVAEQLREELLEARTVAANSDKKAALAEQKILLFEERGKKSRDRQNKSVVRQKVAEV